MQTTQDLPATEARPEPTVKALAVLAGAAAFAAVGLVAEPVRASAVRRWEADAWPTLRSELQAEESLDAYLNVGIGTARADRVAERLIASASAETGAVTGLLNDGRVTLGRWSDRMRAVVGGTVAAAVLLRFGGARLTGSGREVAAAQAGRQFGFLSRFRGALYSGDQPLGDGAAARAELYAHAAWGAGAAGEGRAMLDAGATEAMRVLGASRHCEDCPALADLGWIPIDEMVPIGESACKVRCRCTISYR